MRGFFFHRIFTWKRLGRFAVDVKSESKFVQFHKNSCRGNNENFYEETNSVNFNSSGRFTKKRRKYQIFLFASLDCVSKSLFMKQLSSSSEIIWKLMKNQKFLGENLLQTSTYPRHPCCAAPLDTRPTRTIHFSSQMQMKSLCSVEWHDSFSSKSCVPEKKILRQPPALLPANLVTCRVIEPTRCREIHFTAAFRHKSCGRTQSLHGILFRKFKLSVRCRKF